MVRAFVKLAFINLVLLAVYVVLDFLEWSKISGLTLVANVSWTPFRTQVWFGGTVPVIVDGLLLIDHWSFLVLLVLIATNLIALWKVERRKA